MNENEKSKHRGRKIRIAAALIAAAVIWIVGAHFFEYIELKEIGKRYTEFFFKNLAADATVMLLSFAAVFIVLFANVLVLRRNLRELSLSRGVLEKIGTALAMSLAAAVILTAVFGQNSGERLLVFSNAHMFGESDPVFGKDIGYYMFQRPFLAAICGAGFSVWLIVALLCAAMYYLFGVARGNLKMGDLFSRRDVLVHNSVNLCGIVVLNGFRYMFKAENILYRSFGGLCGAGFTDKYIWLTFYRAAPILLAVLSVVGTVFLIKARYKAVVKTVLIYPAAFIAAGVAAFAVQTLVVSPNEVLRENASIADNIKYTRAAYDLDEISEVEFEIDNDLTADDLTENSAVTENVRILDLSANLTVLNQIQGIRNYYKFNETDIVPCSINGKKTAVAVTAREITKENLSDNADTYINRKLRYTHGFGIVMNSISRVSSEGQPEFLIKDIPPKSADGVPKITQPRIYYGELTDDYVVVGNEKYKELDYSEGQEDVEFSYDGDGGLPLGLFNRVLFAAKYADVRLLISDLVSSDSRILINRNITERLKTVAPFLSFDGDPYIVIDADGSLKWIVDAYTVSNLYPYSQSKGDFNYIRNSVKAVVDAYTGDVKLYISDEDDPIIATYREIYPELFEKDSFPESLRGFVKYPEYLFKVQTEIYGKYHIYNPKTFYNKNDMWVVAKERYGTSSDEKEIEPYYNMMRLEGESEEELLLTIPYTLTNKDNMVAWLAVGNEWENYGKLSVYKFPKDINVYGPMQIENRINSHSEISKELNLWSQGGSKVIRGNMIVVPINSSILYVEPIYIASSNKSALPELKQVAVAYGENIVMKSSLNEALYALFGETAPEESVGAVIGETEGSGAEYDDVAKRVVEEFRRLQRSSAENDWSDFGEAMGALEKSIDELEKSMEQSTEQNTEQNK